jgi:TetR/AcrR family transcriptional repressor of mexJK operon
VSNDFLSDWTSGNDKREAGMDMPKAGMRVCGGKSEPGVLMSGPVSSGSPSSPCCEKEQAVLHAATRIFLRHGFSGATTDMIQREAGVSKATVYACFANKQSLFSAVIEHECAEFMATVRTIDVEGKDLKTTLSEMGRAYLEILLSPDALSLFRVVVAEAARFPELSQQFYQVGPQAAVALFSEQLARFSARKELDLHSIGSDTAARVFLGLLRTDGQLELLMRPGVSFSSVQIDASVRLAVSAFLQLYQPPVSGD